MKFAVFLLLCFVALAAAAPQLIYPATYPGVITTGINPFAPRTVVAGPTVVNGLGPLGLTTRYLTTGYFGPTLI